LTQTPVPDILYLEQAFGADEFMYYYIPSSQNKFTATHHLHTNQSLHHQRQVNREKRSGGYKRARIFRWLIITTFIFTITFVMFMQVNAVSNDSKDAHLNDTSYKQQIVVLQGDTLWGIARTHLPEQTDIRKYIYQITVLNELKGHILHEGQLIVLP
jgi:hypothetical protein